MKISPSQMMSWLGLLFIFAIVWLGLSPIAQASHECHFNQQQELVCPDHEEESQQPETSEGPDNPDGDRDQDGVPDEDDQCPDEAGLADGPNGHGCPESGDAANTGEDVDIDLDEEGDSFETRNECIFDPNGVEVCLFQAFFPRDGGLIVIRVIDRCSLSGGNRFCERLFERLFCDRFGSACEVDEMRQIGETCDEQGECVERVLISGDSCGPQFDICIDLPEESFNPDGNFPRPIFEHVVIMVTPPTCRMEGRTEICEQEVQRCVDGVCTRIARTETRNNCFTRADGSELCNNETSVQTCDGSGTCRTIEYTRHRTDCTADRSECVESTSTYDCVGDTSDFSCFGGMLILKDQQTHTDFPGSMSWQDVECDADTDRCRGVERRTVTAEGETRETTEIYNCSREGVQTSGFPSSDAGCELEARQTKFCPAMSTTCEIDVLRNLVRDSEGRVTRYIIERATDCAPETVIAEDGCAEGERAEWDCDPDGTCTRTILRGWRNSEDSTTSYTGEQICAPVAPLTFQCRTVERTTQISQVTESGEVERIRIHTTCDPDTGICDNTRTTTTCNDDSSTCQRSQRVDEGRCDNWLVNEGSCPDTVSSNRTTIENWERTCMPDGSCTRTGTINEYECDEGERAGLCPGMAGTSYSATEECSDARADTSPENCTLLSSTATTNHRDGRVAVETVTCMPDVPSCQIDTRITHPDGTVETTSWSCGPSESDSTAPYRNGICIALLEER